ncbi:DNA-(apurinic or apyrimidinic site) lyase /endonuclease III [Luteimonas cucumeris]|uniref:Endonuclease III n=2 Tax=Luteimonas cucumeris TaxID=985012 RepID=A0A562LB89_9GAMM|nr:DNA-(apurinic or apyrimidinic site) lyase /endonuclease III [Luteimonas cucumeris]
MKRKVAAKPAAGGREVIRTSIPIGSKRRSRTLSAAEVHEMFVRLSELDPEPTTELEYRTPYELLVAVILSAQATDVGVNKATRRLFPIANTPAAMLALGEEKLKRHIATIGLFNAKAANVIAMSRLLLDRHDGEVPHDREALEALPGVGRKTANVVLNTAFGEPTIAVDTHIFRVSNRTGLAPGRNVREVEDRLLKVVPAEFRQNAHHWLILHGRYVCKARKPDCPRCVIRDLCRYPDKTTD